MMETIAHADYDENKSENVIRDNETSDIRADYTKVEAANPQSTEEEKNDDSKYDVSEGLSKDISEILNESEGLYQKVEQISNYIKDNPGTPIADSFKNMMGAVEEKLKNTVPALIEGKNASENSKDNVDDNKEIDVSEISDEEAAQWAKERLNSPETEKKFQSAEEVFANYDRLSSGQKTQLNNVLTQMKDEIEQMYSKIN